MSIFQGARLVPGATWPPEAAGDEKVGDLAGLTVARLRELCDERGAKAPRKATKAQLLALLGE